MFTYALLPETIAYLTQCTTKPTALWTNALNTLIRQLIIDGNWALLDRMWIFATDNRQNATISICNPTSTAITEVNTPSWTADRGYTSNGTTSYLNSNYNPATNGVNFTQNNASGGIYSRTNQAANNTIDIGAMNNSIGTPANKASIAIQSSNGTGNLGVSITDANAGGSVAIANTIGYMSVSRSNSTQIGAYKNGALLSTIADNSIAVFSNNVYILCSNTNSSPSQFTSRQTSMAYIGGVVNQLTFYNAFNTFRGTIGF